MEIEKLIENAKVCCGDIEAEDCGERCINPRDKRGNELRWCSQWLIHDLHIALSAFQAENEKLRAELEQVRQERDAAVGDMEALMWYSGEGCQICANAVEVHKRPYVRLDCKLGAGIDCKPKWRGKKED